MITTMTRRMTTNETGRRSFVVPRWRANRELRPPLSAQLHNYTMHSVQCTMHNVHATAHNTQYTLHNCTLHNAATQCTMFCSLQGNCTTTYTTVTKLSWVTALIYFLLCILHWQQQQQQQSCCSPSWTLTLANSLLADTVARATSSTMQEIAATVFPAIAFNTNFSQMKPTFPFILIARLVKGNLFSIQNHGQIICLEWSNMLCNIALHFH